MFANGIVYRSSTYRVFLGNLLIANSVHLGTPEDTPVTLAVDMLIDDAVDLAVSGRLASLLVFRNLLDGYSNGRIGIDPAFGEDVRHNRTKLQQTAGNSSCKAVCATESGDQTADESGNSHPEFAGSQFTFPIHKKHLTFHTTIF